MINELKYYITGNTEQDCIKILEAYDKRTVLNHTLRVADKVCDIAKIYKLDKIKLQTAAFLHDISVVIPRVRYSDICNAFDVKIIHLENELPILMHQKVSRIVAEEVFKIKDETILPAIVCHTTLNKKPSNTDMALFIADKLEWDQNGTPPYKEEIEQALSISLENACYAYINYVIKENMLIKPHPYLISAFEYLSNLI